MHAMRDPGQNVSDAQGRMNGFINQKIDEYIKGNDYYALGEAFHSIIDETAPSHEGFQVWYGYPVLGVGNVGFAQVTLAAVHFLREARASENTKSKIAKLIKKKFGDILEKNNNTTQMKTQDEEKESLPFERSPGNIRYLHSQQYNGQ